LRGCSVDTTDERNFLCCSDGLRWHDIHAKSHYDWFSHSSNIKDITSTILTLVLVLPMRGIYDIYHCDGLRWHDIYIPSFMQIGTGIQAILRFCISNLNGCMLVLLMEMNYEVHH
jgi:hypothetical protein